MGRRNFLKWVGACAAGLTFGGCATPVMKPGALDPEMLNRAPVPSEHLHRDRHGELQLRPSRGWFRDIDPTSALTFARLRTQNEPDRFCLLLGVNEKSLTLLPLRVGKTPLDVLADSEYSDALRSRVADFGRQEERSTVSDTVSLLLEDAVVNNRLGPPLPAPTHVYAVAANFPSHLTHDLAAKDITHVRAQLEKARPRVFLKYPPVAPPNAGPVGTLADGGYTGPFDGWRYPHTVVLRPEQSGSAGVDTTPNLDYEVEIGAVVGRRVTRQLAATATDDELRSAIAGYVLISDTKSRNPQVMDKLARGTITRDSNMDAYHVEDPALDEQLGNWDPETCQWWSYAAGNGQFTSVGPFFVAASEPRLPPRGVLSARSYGRSPTRPAPSPGGRKTDTLYVRQCSLTTEDTDYADALIWTLPEIMRSILAPDNALQFMDKEPTLEAGDIVCLGTPGGTVITGKPQFLVRMLRSLLFWKGPLGWHDFFFDKDVGLYLHEGDTVFLWAEGLGFQLQSLAAVSEP